MLRMRRLGGLALPVFGAVMGMAAADAQRVAPAVARMEKLDFRKQRITPAELKGLTEPELKQLRGIIFGRHGRVFGEKAIQDFLQTRPWYRPDKRYRVEVLNRTERFNMDAIKEAEFRLHKQVEPGDLKFYRNREFAIAEAGKHTPVEWRLMRAEVEAIHGRVFFGEPWLQSFFGERYWYKSNAEYTPKSLTRIERRNMATLVQAEKLQRGVALLPGELRGFRGELSPRMLQGLTLQELRLLRNEIYALHGKEFGVPWLDEYFGYLNSDSAPTVRPASVSDLSTVDERNVMVIRRMEELLHDTLANRPITEADLVGLFREDAEMLRLEIAARRGRVFRSRWLQDHFRSKPWYRPDPDYSDDALTETDRKNIAFLRIFEKTAEHAAESEAA